MSSMKIDPDLLEEGKDMAKCPVCLMVLVVPATACPEGHAVCRQCYVPELALRRKCPLCQHPTDATRLQRCRPLEGLIGDLRMRCKHGKEAEEGGGESGAPPRAKRARLEPPQSASTENLREELGRQGLSTKGEGGELAARLEEHQGSNAGEQGCRWRGKVHEFAAHLTESCGYERVPCPNAAAGCKESVLRKDAEGHASETCEYRQSKCAHCSALMLARDLPVHEGICPEAQIECPNAGCGETVARRSMAEHRGACGREEVECPCPGCEERMARAEVGEHMAASGEVHLHRAWKRAAEMEETMGNQAEEIKTVTRRVAEMEEKVADLLSTVVQQDSMITCLQKGVKGFTHMFTWSTDRAWSVKLSLPHTFTDGVRGQCFNVGHGDGEHWMAFRFEEGPACTMHYKCSILDKNDQVLRVVSDPACGDFQKPPERVEETRGAHFTLTEADAAGAVRADGSIKLRMVVHLYLPE